MSRGSPGAPSWADGREGRGGQAANSSGLGRDSSAEALTRAWKDGFSQGREEGGDGEERQDEGSITIMLKSLHGGRATCNQHPVHPLPSPRVPATPSVGCTVFPMNSEPEPQNVTLSGNKVFADVTRGEVLLE